MLTPFFKNLIYMSEIFHLKFKKSQVTDFTSTRNHFPLQWKRQIFPQKGNETKYSEVMCCKTETHDTYYSQQRARCYTMRKTPLWHRQTASPVCDQTFGEVCAAGDAAHVQGLQGFCLVSHMLVAAIYPPSLHMAHKSALLMLAWRSV